MFSAVAVKSESGDGPAESPKVPAVCLLWSVEALGRMHPALQKCLLLTTLITPQPINHT